MVSRLPRVGWLALRLCYPVVRGAAWTGAAGAAAGVTAGALLGVTAGALAGVTAGALGAAAGVTGAAGIAGVTGAETQGPSPWPCNLKRSSPPAPRNLAPV